MLSLYLDESNHIYMETINKILFAIGLATISVIITLGCLHLILEEVPFSMHMLVGIVNGFFVAFIINNFPKPPKSHENN